MSMRPVGGVPPEAILRLLRLLSRRAAAIADVERQSEQNKPLRIEAAAGLLGLVAGNVWQAARDEGLVGLSSDGSGRISGAGLALIRRQRSAAGAPEADAVTDPELFPAAGKARTTHGDARQDDVPRFDADESPLAWLARRRDRSGRPMIEATEFEAGERFRADFHFAHLAPRVTANWSLDAPSGRGRHSGAPIEAELRDNVVAAQERVRRALAAVGPELAGVLIDVCGHLSGLEYTERSSGWPARSGKVVLQLALQALARHYGLKPSSRGACRHWGGEGYRPAIDP